jgi:ornithine--oxo-acid transaminase
VLDDEHLVEHAAEMGRLLLDLTTPLVEEFEVVRDVRGLGLMWAIELGPPAGAVGRRLWESVERRQPGLFAQLVVVPLFHEHHMLCQVAGHHMNVIKALPALSIDEEDVRRFAAALRETIAAAERYPAALARFGLRAGLRSGRVRR